MLEASDITYGVGDKTLIADVSVTFAPGKLHLIIGPNGAGKSTLIKVLARLLRPQEGVVRYEGVDVRHAGESELAKRRAVLSQAIEVAFPLAVREVVMMGRYPHFGGRPGPADEKITDELMRFFDVTEFAERDYQTLSGGERQRVNFARVLAQLWRDGTGQSQVAGTSSKPSPCRFLFLDEPLTFLDIRHQIEFMKKVRAFTDAPDVVTVGVVHDLNLAARFADQIVLMNNGRVVSSGTAAEVLTAGRIREVFGVEPTFVPVEQAGVHIVFD
ncbi:MAG TPA: heme ABC transporter ATP-binding protein [Pyrinomonadaceae bacterium]|jgi:iron complex transport system ATP-binding protein|nr:heme ABC transporter ATP-binding protein [Pyrinomonadaceae bacterium]